MLIHCYICGGWRWDHVNRFAVERCGTYVLVGVMRGVLWYWSLIGGQGLVSLRPWLCVPALLCWQCT